MASLKWSKINVIIMILCAPVFEHNIIYLIEFNQYIHRKLITWDNLILKDKLHYMILYYFVFAILLSKMYYWLLFLNKLIAVWSSLLQSFNIKKRKIIDYLICTMQIWKLDCICFTFLILIILRWIFFF